MNKKRPFGVGFIAVVNGIAFLTTLLFWGLVFIRHAVPFPSELSDIVGKANAATTYGFMICDTVYSLPLLFIGTFGIWRMSSLGWTAAQMANILWIYSITLILIRDLNSKLSPGGVIFIPFAVISVWSIIYLWKQRDLFWGKY